MYNSRNFRLIAATQTTKYNNDLHKNKFSMSFNYFSEKKLRKEIGDKQN